MFPRKTLTLVPACAALLVVANLDDSDSLWMRVIASWPETPKSTAKQMAEKYGAPDVVGNDLLEWQNKGPYEWIRVNAVEVPHNFPIEHKDVLDMAIAYKVPVSMFNRIAEFDGSAVMMRTKGLLVASCFMEGLNILILNLANDVVLEKKTPAQARMAFGQIATGMMKGEKHPYTDALQFEPEPLSKTRDPDKALEMQRLDRQSNACTI